MQPGTIGIQTTPKPVSRTYLLVVIGLVLAAACTFLLATRWGIGASPDSVSYVSRALLIAENENVWQVIRSEGAFSSQHAPLYSLVLAVPTLFGIDPLAAARQLHTLFFAGNLLLIGFILWRNQHHWWVSPVGMLLFGASTVMLTIHAYIWSESLFILLSITGIYIFANALTTGERIHYVVAAGLFALACLTRYAGIPLIISAAIALMLQQRQTLQKRFANVAILFLISGLPLFTWFLRNWMVEGSTASRTIAFHPIGKQHLWQAIFTITGWLNLPPSTPGRVRLLIIVVLTAMAAFITWRYLVKGHSVTSIFSHKRVSPLILLLAIFTGVYLAFLALSISFLDANTPLDDRILSPVFVSALLLLLLLADRLALALPRWGSLSIQLILSLLVALSIARTTAWTATNYVEGLGASSRVWRQSQLLQEANALPDLATATVFSNATEVVYFNTHRQALTLPRYVHAMSRVENRKYETELATLVREVEQQRAIVIYLRAFADRPVTSEQELRSHGLVPVIETTDGAIYAIIKE